MTVAVTVLASFALPITPAEADIIGGDVIKLNFQSTLGTSLSDWNQLSGNGNIGDGSVIRHGDGATVSGVTIALTNADGNNTDANTDNWGGFGSDPYYVADARDLVFGTGNLTVTFGGLDDALNYNIRVYSLINNDSFTADLNISVTDGGGTISRTGLGRNALFAAVPLSDDLIFSSVSTDGSGNIVVTQSSLQNHSWEAVVLEANPAAVPEPSSLALMIATGSGAFFWRRRKSRLTKKEETTESTDDLDT